MVQYSSLSKSRISFSRSQMSRMATDLHPPRAEAPFHLLPEDGGDEISHEAVQDAPCLLGLVEAPVQLVGPLRAPP